MMNARRRIDHVVVAVRDLDAAGTFFQRLGFQVGARNRHPWGTENRLIQCRSSFIELITVGDAAGVIPDHAPGQFSFGAFVRDFLGRREGMAMLVLDSADAEADAAGFARAGIGAFQPFFFERKGKRPDGSEASVAFTLAFAVDKQAPGCGFFVCQQHVPENFWTPAFQRHDVGAQDIVEIGMSATDPWAHADFLSHFSGAEAERDGDAGLRIGLRGGAMGAVARQGVAEASAAASGAAAAKGRRRAQADGSFAQTPVFDWDTLRLLGRMFFVMAVCMVFFFLVTLLSASGGLKCGGRFFFPRANRHSE